MYILFACVSKAYTLNFCLMQVKFVLVRVLSSRIGAMTPSNHYQSNQLGAPKLDDNTPSFLSGSSDSLEASLSSSTDSGTSADLQKEHLSAKPTDSGTVSPSKNAASAIITATTNWTNQDLMRDARRLIELCNELLSVLDVLDPGISVNRGRVIKELIAPIMKLSQCELDCGSIDGVEFKLRKMYCAKLAKDMVECYKFEFI